MKKIEKLLKSCYQMGWGGVGWGGVGSGRVGSIWQCYPETVEFSLDFLQPFLENMSGVLYEKYTQTLVVHSRMLLHTSDSGISHFVNGQ